MVRLLAQGGVRTVELRDCLWNTTSRFPKCLAYFKGLRALTITRGCYRLMECDDFGRELRLLPTLESLKIECKEAMSTFLLTASPADLFNLLELPDSQESRATDSLSPRHTIWSLREAFPRLKTLWIDSPGSRKFAWHKSDLLLLPDSLTSLKLPCLDSHDVEYYQNLPRGLVELYLGDTRSISSDCLQALPPNLTSLIWDSILLPFAVMAVLPPSITKCGFRAMSWTLDAARSIPPLISSLTLQDVSEDSFDPTRPGGQEYDSKPRVASEGKKDTDENVDIGLHSDQQESRRWQVPSTRTLSSWHSSLPSFLVYLRFDNDSKFQMDCHKVSLLPRTLKCLDLFLMDWSGFNSSSRPFPNLERLTVIETRGFSVDSAASLPNSLTELFNFKSRRNIHECGFQVDTIAHFPRNLHNWSLYISPGAALSHIPEGLPTRLNGLQIATGRLVPPIGLSTLPTFLQILSITSPFVWGARETESLPRHLYRLDCESSAISADAVSKLPAHLLELRISEFVHPYAPDSASRSWRRVFGQGYDMQDDARESDEEWDLVDENSADFTPDFDANNPMEDDEDEDDDEVYQPRPKRCARDFELSGFPASLIILYMRENIHYSPQVFANLPSSLRAFTTGILPRECLHMMPQKLTSIDARVCGPVADEDIAALPRQLTGMFLRFQDDSHLSKDVWRAFPESIERTVSCDYSKFLQVRRSEYDRILHGPIATPDSRVLKRYCQ